LHAQRVWFTATLLTFTPCPSQLRQDVSPATEKLPAPQPAPQTVLLVAEQAAAVTAPAHEVQGEHGAKPVAL